MDGGGGTTCAPADPRPAGACALRAAPVPPEAAASDGGGGTTAFPPASPSADKVRCAVTGNRGAGAITSERPTLMSPSLRTEAALRAGGGSTTEDSGPRNVRRVEAALASGAGATTSIDNEATARTPFLISGGGATIPSESELSLRLEDWVRSGTGATIGLGSAGNWEGLRSMAAAGTGTL